ncbi:MAG: DUF4179 domain-containing protein [Bacillota bacterium]
MSDIFRKILIEDAARINVSQITWKQVKQGHRRTRTKTDWKRGLLIYGASAAILLIVAIGASGFVSPVMAKVLQKIPIIGELYSFNDPKLNQYSSETNLSVTDKGITISVPKVYYDGKRLFLIYTIQVPEGYEPIPNRPQIMIPFDKVQMNGKRLSGGATSWDSLESKNMYRGYIEYSRASDQILENGTLTIPIDQVGKVKGSWMLSVPVSNTTVYKTIEAPFPKNASATYDGITLTVNKVSKGPVYTDISMELRQTLQANGKPKSKMNLVDSFGVPMMFNVVDTNHQFINPAYINYDEHFKEVGNEKIWNFTIECKTPPSDVKTIVIEPVLLVLHKEGVTEGNCPKIPQLAVTVPLD